MKVRDLVGLVALAATVGAGRARSRKPSRSRLVRRYRKWRKIRMRLAKCGRRAARGRV